jgi:hypothetical protein
MLEAASYIFVGVLTAATIAVLVWMEVRSRRKLTTRSDEISGSPALTGRPDPNAGYDDPR